MLKSLGEKVGDRLTVVSTPDCLGQNNANINYLCKGGVHGEEREVTKHGEEREVTRHGEEREVTKHGEEREVTKHGEEREVTKHADLNMSTHLYSGT